MSDFGPQVVRQIKEIDDRLAKLRSYPVGPALAELPGDFLDLPGLRGLWLAGSADNTGAMYDRSGQGRTLTYNGNPTLGLYNSTVPYWDYDGTGDYHSRADEAGLDVLGTETVIAASLRGMTVGGWFWSNSLGTRHTLISKSTGIAADTNYWLEKSSDDKVYQWISDGVTLTNVNSSAALAVNTWYFAVGRFTPSTELAVFVNGVKAVNVASIPAALVNGATALNIASVASGANLLTGRGALSFLCAAALPDDLLDYLWMRGRALFGV